MDRDTAFCDKKLEPHFQKPMNLEYLVPKFVPKRI